MEKTKETMSSPNILDFCRLCLVKENVSVLIFEEGEDSRQIFRKISACLPVKVSRDDELPKKICDDCVCRLDSTYEFCNLSANSEKQLLQWLADSNSDHRKEQISLNTLETEQFTLKEEALDEQLIEVPKASSHVDSGVSDEIEQRSDEEDESEMDVEDDGTNSIDESEDTAEKDSEEEDFRVEPTTFVNVSMHDGDAGPSGIQKTDSEQPTEETLATLGPSTSKQSPAASGFASDSNINYMNLSEGSPLYKICSIRRRQTTKSSQKCFEEAYDSYGGIENLEIIHNTVLETKNYCDFCRFSFTSQDDLEIHMKEHIINNDFDKFICNECGLRFDTKSHLEKHITIHKIARPYSCDICNKSFKEDYEKANHMKKHSEESKFTCDICGYSTIYKSALVIHHKRHNEEYKYRCDVCGKGFFVQTWLQEHKNYHSGKKPYECDICGKSFPYTRYLTAHKKSAHSDINQTLEINQCETCGKIFAHRKSLLLHVKSHTGEIGCLCDICGKVLTNKDHLKFHRRVHTGEKPNICDWCGKGFSKPFNLKVHKRIHTGERPYACDSCEKTFTQRSSLVIHERKHSGQRPYLCKFCDKSFVCKALLNAHLKSCDG